MSSSLPATFFKGLALFLVLMPFALPASAAPTAKPRSKAAVIPLLSAEEFKRQEQWRSTIATKPQPKKGCFTASYPSLEWREIPCVNGPERPMAPRSGIVPEVVGNGDDIAAQAPSGHISSAIGSFDSLTNLASESGPIGNAGPSHPDTYTLQINTEFFTTTVCGGSPNPSCRGWEQFVFENNPSNHRAFIQYWLVNFDGACPANFQSFPIGGGHNHCVQLSNLSGAVPTTAVPVTNLGQVSLTGSATAGADSIVMTISGTAFMRNGDNSVNASSGWTIAEFNILGDGGDNNGVGGTATFNNGAQLVTRTRINYGGNDPPNCVAQGFTAEMNNLSFGPSPPVGSGPGPAVIFTESTAGGSPSNCAASTSVGDTHLTTLSGLLYDFQAIGDFELLATKSGFIVQNRQVSGAPNWPNAAVNSAIATQVGKTRVAVCLAPQRLVVNGKELALRPGKVELLGDGTQISLRGSTYLIRGASGDWVKASVNTSYIDVLVGLGRWPIAAQGLLVNVNGDPNKVATRDGTVMSIPFSFEEFYRRYGESWRVKSGESMLNVCGETKSGVPTRTFYARDLDQELAKRVRAICVKAGVKEGPLLDACMIDVAFTGQRSAAKIHAVTREPLAVGLIK